jgi:hypothetical protein
MPLPRRAANIPAERPGAWSKSSASTSRPGSLGDFTKIPALTRADADRGPVAADRQMPGIGDKHEKLDQNPGGILMLFSSPAA